jgi:signal transduction histidine kinase
MLFAILNGRKLMPVLSNPTDKKSWKRLLTLMVIFFVGYLLAMGLVMTGNLTKLAGLTSLIFAMGAVFVLISVSVTVNMSLSLDSALKGRDEFINIASHELRNPLASLLLQSQLLEKYFRAISDPDEFQLNKDKFQKLVLANERQVNHLTLLINKLFSAAVIGSGKLLIQPVPLELSELTRDVINGLEFLLADHHSKVELEVISLAPGLWDRQSIEQVIINLITNALKYGKGNNIRVVIDAQEGNAVLKVIDQGVGIALVDAARIFERFERVQNDKDVRGMGLGLYIVKKIVEEHRGSVSVTSTPGTGTTFMVKLPSTQSFCL